MMNIIDEFKISKFIDRSISKFFIRLVSQLNRQLAIVLCVLSIALSGCVKYDTGINFSSLNYGEIVEHVQLSEQLNSFSQNAVQTWISSIQERTKQAEGKIEWINDREFKVIIPFNNAQELVMKIDRYFNSNLINPAAQSKFNTHMQIEQSNFLLLVRNHLLYDIDLRSILTQSGDPKVSVSSNNFVDLNFNIQSPWGVNNNDIKGNIVGVKTMNDRRVNWQLKAGELNHLDATFWLPNPLGIGTILILLISGVGYYLKYRQLPGQLQAK